MYEHAKDDLNTDFHAIISIIPGAKYNEMINEQ